MKRRSARKTNQAKRAIIIVLLFIIVFAAIFYFLRRDQEEPIPATSQLTGLEVADEVANRPVLGIMIENSLPARPQTGLGNAGIVFEATTEGGITRYLALYQENQPEEVGPVRSLREHFLNWAMGFDASIAHVGGSAQALTLADNRNAKSLNQFSHPDPYYRTNNRQAPHNMHVRLAALRDLQNTLSFVKSKFEPLVWSDENPAAEPDAINITTAFSQALYEAMFQYDAESNSYKRFLANEPHLDSVSNEQISVKNLLVIVTSSQNNTPKSIGSGEAFIFKDGTMQPIRWQQSSYDSRVEFMDDEGNQIPLNRGKTWIAVVSSRDKVTY